MRRAMAAEERAAATSRKLSGRSASDGGETRDKIGTFAGVSGRTVEKIALAVAPTRNGPHAAARVVVISWSFVCRNETHHCTGGTSCK